MKHVRMTDEQIRYSCDQCDYKTTNKEEINRHVRVTHAETRYPCNHCQYKTTKKEELMNHVEIICYSCDPCDYETTKKGKHNRHVRMTHENCDYDTQNKQSSRRRDHVVDDVITSFADDVNTSSTT